MKELLTILLKNMINKKINFITIFILLFSLFLIFSLFCYYDKSINNEYINNANNRTLIASIKDEKALEKVKKITHIKHVFSKIPYIKLNVNEKQYIVEYAYDLDLNDNEIIACFNSSSIIANYKEKEYQYYIKSNLKKENCQKIYMNMNDITKIINDNKIDYNKSDYIIIVDKYSSLENVINELNEMNIEASLIDSTGVLNIKNYQKMLNLLIIMIILFVIFINMIIYFIIKQVLNEENKYIGYMKIVGYKTKDILKLLTIRNICYISLIYIICFIISNIIILTVGMNIFNYNLYLLLSLLLFLILLLFIILVSIKVKKVIKNQSLITLIKQS